MKKLLSIAIAAAVAAPMAVNADTTLYGIMDFTLANTDKGGVDAWDLEDGNGSSRLGVKGSEDLGNGLKAIFQYEWSTGSDISGDAAGGTYNSGTNGQNSGLSTRVAKVGLSGGFGTVAVGRMWSPYYMSVGKLNIHDMSGSGSMGSWLGGGFRYSNSVKYSSPNMNGFSAEAMITTGNDATDADASTLVEDGVDNLSLGLNYNNGPISVGLGYEDRTTGVATDSDWLGVSGSYNFGNFMVVAGYQDQSNTAANTDVDAFQLAGQAFFGNNTLTLSYGERDSEVAGADLDVWALGVRHAFSKRTRVYAEYSQLDSDTAADDTDKFGIGLRHDF